MDGNGWKWMEMGWKWDGNGMKWMEMDGNGWKWMEMEGNGWKWMEMEMGWCIQIEISEVRQQEVSTFQEVGFGIREGITCM